MQQGTIVDLTLSGSLAAARLSFDLHLPMADSMILATARAWEATFWTQDSYFAGIPGVRYIPRQSDP